MIFSTGKPRAWGAEDGREEGKKKENKMAWFQWTASI